MYATALSTRRWFPVDPIYVADYSTLRGIYTDSLIAFVTGYFSDGSTTTDTVAGWFMRDDNDTTSADDGASIIVSGSGKRWKRINFTVNSDIFINVKSFGAVGDGVTNDYAAVRAALDYAKTEGNVLGNFVGTRPVYFPPGKYYMGANTLELHAIYHLIGCGRGISPGHATELIWDANTSGIIAHQSDTTGVNQVSATPLGYADGTIIDGFKLTGGWLANPVEGEYHAVQLRCPGIVRNCLAMYWQGDGFMNHAAAGAPAGASPPRGNVNMWKIEKCRSYVCRDGFSIFGSDANAGSTHECQATSSRRHGFRDSSFLGNTHYTSMVQEICRTAWNDGITWPASCVSYLGQRYYVRPGQAVGAAANAPSGTATDNTWWGWFGAGGASSAGGTPAWFAGINVREGFTHYSTNINSTTLWIAPYREGDETKAALTQSNLVIGGTGMAIDSTAYPNFLRTSGNQLRFQGSMASFIDQGTNAGWNALLGSYSATTALTYPDGIGGASVFSLRHSGGDTLFDLGGTGVGMYFTGLATTQQFGTGAIYPRAFYFNNLMIGPSLAAARKFSLETVVPSANAHGQGEVMLNRLPATQGLLGWWCTTAGTPGTWQPIPVTQGYKITAVASSTNSALIHAQCHLRFTNAGATVYTVQPNATIAFEIGTTITLERTTAGAVSVAAGAGVTINSKGGGLAITAQWGVATLRKVDTDTWILYGDI